MLSRVIKTLALVKLLLSVPFSAPTSNLVEVILCFIKLEEFTLIKLLTAIQQFLHRSHSHSSTLTVV